MPCLACYAQWIGMWDDMKRLYILLLFFCCLLLCSCTCDHDWLEISRAEPGCAENGIVRFFCSKCDETHEETIPATGKHTWVDASCDASKHCSECGLKEGTATGHTWIDATCTEPKRCSICNATDGEALGHTVTIGLCENCGYQVTLYGLYAPKDYEVFKVIKSVIEDFKNPASVKVVKIHYFNEEDNVYHITISAENSFGGTTSACYRISSHSIMKSSTYSYRTDSSFDISSINELIRKYCKSQGWK